MPSFIHHGLLIVLGCWVLAAQTNAQIVGWHPLIDPHHIGTGNTGKGIDLRNPDKVKPLVANLASTSLLDKGPTDGGQHFGWRYANSAFEIANSVGANLAVAVRSAVTQADLNINFADKQTFSEEGVTWLFEGERDFGSRTYPFQDRSDAVSQELKDAVKELQNSFTDPKQLHAEIVKRFGSHYVYGYRSVARVRIAFTLRFNSKAQARQFRGDISASHLASDFTAKVESVLSSAESNLNVSYDFYSSEESLQPSFTPQGNLRSLEQYQDIARKAVSYLGQMSPEKSKVDAWIVAPLENIPGYYRLLRTFHPEAYLETQYDEFMRVHSQIRAAKAHLDSTVDDDARMNWLNEKGKELFRTTHRNLNQQLTNLNSRALEHFERGMPLSLSASDRATLQDYNRLPFPTIEIIDRHGQSGGVVHYSEAIYGCVNWGAQDLTKKNGFQSVFITNEGKEVGHIVPLQFDKQKLEGNRDHPYPAGRILANRVFTGERWQSLWADAKTNNHIGFFYIEYQPGPPINPATLAIALKSAYGDILDSHSFTEARTSR